MDDIRSRDWVAAQLNAGETVTRIAAKANVSRQTAYTWISRHGLRATPKAKPRPVDDELLALYHVHGSAAALAEHLGVSADTARRWIIAAGGNPPTAGRRRTPIDLKTLRKRRARGATLNELAVEFGVSAETVRKRLQNDTRDPDR